MKRNILILMTVAATVLLTSCGTQVPTLSKLDNNKAAEYMAGEMLKNDEDYAFAFDYDRSVLYATPTPAPTLTPVSIPQDKDNGKNGGTSANGQTGGTGTGSGSATGTEEVAMQEVSLSDVFGIKGLTIDVESSGLKKSYGNGYESFVAADGKKFLIVYFKIKNTADADRKVNLTKNESKYRLSIGGKTISPTQSVAAGDLQYFNNKISAGKSAQGILMFEVDKNATLDGSSLIVTNGTKRATVSLK